MSKLEQLKKEIQRLRPEIMELKFGCELNNVFTSNERNNIFIEKIGKQFRVFRPTFNEVGLFVEPDKTFEILGRPITIEDVLAVLRDVYSSNIFISSTGRFYHLSELLDEGITILKDINDKAVFWLLGKPLDEQSEETINFIHSLIIKHK